LHSILKRIENLLLHLGRLKTKNNKPPNRNQNNICLEKRPVSSKVTFSSLERDRKGSPKQPVQNCVLRVLFLPFTSWNMD